MAERNYTLYTPIGPVAYVESDQERDITVGGVALSETLEAAAPATGVNLLCLLGVG
jgi:hypothetical protein